MDPSCLVITVQAGGGGVMDVFLAHFRPLSANWASVYLSIVPAHVHPFMATMSPSSDGYFQQCHKAPIISNWFLEHVNELTVLKWPPQSPDLNPIEHLWDINCKMLSYQYGPTFLKKCFQHLVESMPHRIKAKGGQTQY